MSQVKDFPDREAPEPDDFTYLITEGNSDFKLRIKAFMGELITPIIDPNYELLTADQYHTIRMTFPGNKELTVPLELDQPFVIGTVILVRNISAFLITLLPATIAVTLNTKSGLDIVANGEAKLVYNGSNEWDVVGDLS